MNWLQSCKCAVNLLLILTLYKLPYLLIYLLAYLLIFLFIDFLKKRPVLFPGQRS